LPSGVVEHIATALGKFASVDALIRLRGSLWNFVVEGTLSSSRSVFAIEDVADTAARGWR
jgi:hypothetical protein